MEKKDKRFQVSIKFEAKELKDGVPTDFVKNELSYSDIGEDGLVAIEASLIEFLGQMNDWGVMQAMEHGLGDRLSALGLDQRVSALSVGKGS